MAVAIADLVLAYAGFLCAWPAIVAVTGERATRRYGARIGADMRAVAGPGMALIFLATPLGLTALDASMEVLAVPAVLRSPLAWGVILCGGSLLVRRVVRRIALRRYGATIRDDLGVVTRVIAPSLALLCLLIEAQLFAGLVVLSAWVALGHHRAQVARETREAAARARAAQTYHLRSRIGGEESPFRR